MPNQRKATFMVSSMPNKAMKAGKKAVIGMARIGAAIGFTSSKSQRKLAIRIPKGIAMIVHHKNAWAMRHQLFTTFPSRSYSVQSFPNARMTPMGLGKEKGGRISQWVRANQASRRIPQLKKPRANRARGEVSFRIAKSLLMFGSLANSGLRKL